MFIVLFPLRGCVFDQVEGVAPEAGKFTPWWGVMQEIPPNFRFGGGGVWNVAQFLLWWGRRGEIPPFFRFGGEA
jgi:hypothetical protein